MYCYPEIKIIRGCIPFCKFKEKVAEGGFQKLSPKYALEAKLNFACLESKISALVIAIKAHFKTDLFEQIVKSPELDMNSLLPDP